MSQRRIVVLAGPNGAGKSTSARALVNETLGIQTFVNADVIAQGLAGFAPESIAVEAGRIMLNRLNELAADRMDFAFETTLAARSYVHWLTQQRGLGYQVSLYFFWLATPELAAARVAHRVQNGGHSIPEETIRRRYGRGIGNLVNLYIPIVDNWCVFDNSRNDEPIAIATGLCGRVSQIYNEDAWEEIQRLRGEEND